MNPALLASRVNRNHEEAYSRLAQSENAARLFQHPAISSLLEADAKIASTRDWWKRTSGLHTVSNFVHNYQNHPAGWGALLMIHGIPEVTSRLRSKVDNFAIYSALFLSTAISALMDPPEKVAFCEGGFECQLRKRIFFYCLIVGVVAQILCITLALAFGNALNEAARDADVFRMFSPAGQGFMATKKTEYAYLTGVGVTCIAVLVTLECYMGWEVILVTAIISGVAGKIYHDTESRLFKSAGIVDYWRKGKPEDDPYDLEVLLQAFEHQASGQSEIAGAFADLESGFDAQSFQGDRSERSCIGLGF